MAVTDADQLLELSWRLIERDVTFPSGLWTVAEIASYYYDRQNRFNRDTKLLLAHQPAAATTGVAEVTLPQDFIAAQRVTWKDTPTGTITPMERSDRYAGERGLPSTFQPDRPTLFITQSPGTLTAELAPVPTTDGEVGLLYASTLEPLGFTSPPDIFDVPDDFVPYITYGVLADMLSKEGRGQDLARAKYCEDRYEEGVLIAAFLLAGILG